MATAVPRAEAAAKPEQQQWSSACLVARSNRHVPQLDAQGGRHRGDGSHVPAQGINQQERVLRGLVERLVRGVGEVVQGRQRHFDAGNFRDPLCSYNSLNLQRTALTGQRT